MNIAPNPARFFAVKIVNPTTDIAPAGLPGGIRAQFRQQLRQGLDRARLDQQSGVVRNQRSDRQRPPSPSRSNKSCPATPPHAANSPAGTAINKYGLPNGGRCLRNNHATQNTPSVRMAYDTTRRRSGNTSMPTT